MSAAPVRLDARLKGVEIIKRAELLEAPLRLRAQPVDIS